MGNLSDNLHKKFRKPSLNNEWAPANTTEIKSYYEIGKNSGPRIGYRILDQYAWNKAVLKPYLREFEIFR